MTRKVFPPCTNTSPKLRRGSGPDRSSPRASFLSDKGDPSTTTFNGKDAVGAPGTSPKEVLGRYEVKEVHCAVFPCQS